MNLLKSSPAKNKYAAFAYLNTIPVVDNRVLLRSHFKEYEGMKAIATALLRQKMPVEIVWIINENMINHLRFLPRGVKYLMNGTDEALEALASARIWIDNTWRAHLLEKNIPKKKEQIYIQLWHGSAGIKRYCHERYDASASIVRAMQRDLNQVDIFLSASATESDFYRRVLAASDVREFGQPKHDIFYSPEQEYVKLQIKKRLGLPEDVKLLYYAPSPERWRSKKAVSPQVETILAALSKRFGGKWMMAARMHPLGLRKGYLPVHESLLNISDEPNEIDLLLAADACLSDYSSCVFDFLHTGKPCFLYAADYMDYAVRRGFNLSPSECPFPLATDMKQLIKHIESFDQDLYTTRLDAYRREHQYVAGGHAAERCADMIREMISPPTS